MNATIPDTNQLQKDLEAYSHKLADLQDKVGQALAAMRGVALPNHKHGQMVALAPSGRRAMSPESRARIAAVVRARWKKAKASGKNAL